MDNLEPATTPGPVCAHGCGETTKGGRYRPGHDAKHVANLWADIQAKLKTPAEALAELDGQPNLHNKLVARLWKAGFQFDPETRRWS